MSDRPVVIVTGASRGIGAAVADWLAQEQAGLTLVARTFDALKSVAKRVESLGGEALPLRADLSDVDACYRAVTATLDHFGRLDALVNNAAVLPPIGWLSEAGPEAWRYNIEVNLLGPAYLMQAAIPALRERRGRIVNVSSGVAVSPREGWSAYCASKAGLLHLTRVVATEEPAITAISVQPGAVDTQMQIQILEADPGTIPEERRERIRELKEMGELEPPEVPARSIAWLALHAPHEWSGEFVRYDEQRVMEQARSALGERTK
jgi:NAD(P)-dependent dehydrogenase (short-subunit alcohol dehydrogenase family)